jgi:hypothetical protein
MALQLLQHEAWSMKHEQHDEGEVCAACGSRLAACGLLATAGNSLVAGKQ